MASGTGRASAITVDAFPHVPGSLNVTVGSQLRNMLLAAATHRFPSQRSFDRYLQGDIAGIPVWVGFSKHKVGIELFAEVHLRDVLGLSDGGIVEVNFHFDR